MRVYGTSENICSCDGTMVSQVDGWKDRVTGQVKEDEKYICKFGEDKGTLKFVMANPTVDAYVCW